jgi:O-antigen/teichoic acid export membrane protein
MGRTKRFISGVSLGYAGQALTIVVGLWLTPFLLGRIGTHDYGLWLVALQMLAYVSLLDVGVVALLPRETAFATGRRSVTGDGRELPALVGETARLVLWQTPLAAVVAVAVWLSIPSGWAALRPPLGVALAAFVLLFPARIFQAVLQGLQDLAFVARTQIAAWLAGLALTVWMVFEGFGLYAVVAGWAATQLLAAPACWLRLRLSFPEALPRGLPRLTRRAARRRLGQGLLVSAGQVALTLVTGTDLLIIGALIGPAAVVPYACTAKLMSVLANQPQLLMQAAGPALSEIRVSESRERVASVCAALGQAMLLASGGLVCVVLAVNGGFVGWWVGAENFGGVGLTALILLNVLLRHWALTIAYPLFFFGHDRHFVVTPLLDGLLSVASIAVFVWAFGAIGAPLGSIVGVCAVSLPRHLRMLARETGLTVSETLAPLRPWGWRFALLVAAACASALLWRPRTFASIALTAAAAAAAYVVVMLPLLQRRPLSAYVPARVSHLLAKVVGVPSAGEAA